MQTTSNPPTWEPFGTHLENPSPFYRTMRQEAPLFYSEALGMYLVTRSDDIDTILRRPDVFSSHNVLQPASAFAPETSAELAKGFLRPTTIVDADGEEHRRLRAPVERAFALPRMKAVQEHIRTRAHRLVDLFIHDQYAELLSQFAEPLAVETMLALSGIPEVEMEQCTAWSRSLVQFLSGPLPPEEQVVRAQGFVAFQHFFADLIAKRRQAPMLGTDLLSEMMRDQFDDATIIHTLIGILMAGHETTANLIGNGVVLLLQTPMWQHLCERACYKSAVEEMLRFDSSVQAFRRLVVQETEIAGVTLPAGASLILLYGSANRDEKHFPGANTFDLHRKPNAHFSFGRGAHVCAGAYLARMEGAIAFEVLCQRLPRLALRDQEHLHHVPTLLFRGYQRIDVRF